MANGSSNTPSPDRVFRGSMPRWPNDGGRTVVDKVSPATGCIAPPIPQRSLTYPYPPGTMTFRLLPVCSPEMPSRHDHHGRKSGSASRSFSPLGVLEMANKYPYVASAGPIMKTVSLLRRSFPKEVTADTLRKLGVAPKNESYVINVLRFLGVIDDEGMKVDNRARALVNHDENAFKEAFGALVREAYEELFELHGEASWSLDRNSLTQFFRTTDHSSDVVGTRQAATFAALAAISGHAEVPAPKAASQAPKRATALRPGRSNGKREATDRMSEDVPASGSAGSLLPPASSGTVGLTVRIEVNLPAAGDQETYDRIFRSIRENLIDGKST